MLPIKLFVLLYADDTIVLAENEHQLQTALNTVVINFPMFKYGSSTIEVVSEYVYLGLAIKELCMARDGGKF